MQPCSHDRWFQEYEDDSVFVVKNRFFHPALRPFREKLAQSGVARTREISNYLCQFENYFANKSQFRKWLITVSYREALRILLHLEHIETALEELAQEPRAVVRWSYIDQLTEEEIARLLDLRTDSHLLFDLPEARGRMIDAYKQLCRIILRRFRPTDADEAERFKDCSRIFPSPPTLSGNLNIMLEHGLPS